MSAVRRRGSVVILAAACALSVMIASGCGASAVIDPVAQAATASTEAPGYRMTFSLELSSPALATPFTSVGSGSFDARDRAASLTMDTHLGNNPQIANALGGSVLRVQEVITGLVVYMKLPAAITDRLPGGKPWLKLDLAHAAAAAGIPDLSSISGTSLSSDPSQLLNYLKGVSGGLTTVGSDRVAGFATTHYRADISLDRVPDVVPAKLRGAARQSVTALENLTHLHQVPVDVWVDQQRLVRRMQMSFAIPETSGQSANMAMTLTIPSYGPQPKPAIPPSDQVTDLNALLGSSG